MRASAFFFVPVLVLPCYAVLTLEHVKLLPNNALEVTEIARKANGASAAKRAASHTKIIKHQFAFTPGSRIGFAPDLIQPV